MKALPEGFHESHLIASLADGWGLDVQSARYAAVGFGSYHWDVTDAAGRRYFVTVDDLDQKSWLGRHRDSAFDGLRAALDTALALRRDAGLQFVLAPIPAADGETVRRACSRHSVALFPFVHGSCGRLGEERAPALRSDVIGMLAELHRAAGVVLPIAPRRYLELTERDCLEAALGELDRRWTGGPFSEPARDLLASHASALRRRLDTFDRLAGEVAEAGAELVITHGEPHAGNWLRTVDKVFLVDWDTVGLGPPERDLWLVTRDADELALYTDATGRKVDTAAIALYRLRWELDDIALYTTRFRSAHAHTADTEKAWHSLSGYLRSYGAGRSDGLGRSATAAPPPAGPAGSLKP